MRLLALLLAVCGVLSGQVFFPIEDVRAGQRGTGLTVFSGDTVEQFDVEILGVLENFSGPKTNVIFGRLSGGPLQQTGVMSGMSGSPVYIDGLLAGAVAFTFPFAKEPLAGIRPIGEMIRGADPAPADASAAAVAVLDDWREVAGVGRRTPATPDAGARQLDPIATPVSLGGFSPRTLQVYAEDFQRLGLRPLQGSGGALRQGLDADAAAELKPGSMISVGLIRGDLNLSASGTVTYVDGGRLLAFGHRFLSTGSTSMPMMRASVMALVPNLSASFKLSGTGPLIGEITLDSESGIAGEVGLAPSMVPCTIRVKQGGGREETYSMELVRDAQLVPFLLQIALFSAIDASEPSFGPLTARVRGGVRFANGLPRLVLDDIYAGTGAVGQVTALSTAAPLSYLLQTGHANLGLEAIDLEVEATPTDEYSDIVRAWLSKPQVRPGETIEIRLAVKGPDGREEMRSVPYAVPVSMPAGTVEVTVGDALTANLQRWRGLLAGRKARDAAATIRVLNSLRGSDGAYVRLWQRKRSIWLHADKLPVPPASLHAVLSTPTGRGAGALPDLSTTITELGVDGLRGVVRGRLALRFVVTGS